MMRARRECLATKGIRPKRRAAATHFFKYQLANNPSRAEENDLKRALQESLEEHNGPSKNTSLISSTNSSDLSRSNNTSSSADVSLASITSATSKRNRPNRSANESPSFKRAKLNVNTNGYRNTNCDGNLSVSLPPDSPSASPHINSSRAIRTYSRSHPNHIANAKGQTTKQSPISPKVTPTTTCTTNGSQSGTNIVQQRSTDSNISTTKSKGQPCVSKSTQTPNIRLKKNGLGPTTHSNGISASLGQSAKSTNGNANNSDTNETSDTVSQTNVPLPYLKFKRESKNYAYVKMTALKVSTSKSPSSNSKSFNSKKRSPNCILSNNGSNKDSPKSISPKSNAIESAGSNTIVMMNSSLSNDPRTNLASPNTISRKSPKTNSNTKSSPQNGKSQDNNHKTSPKANKDLQGPRHHRDINNVSTKHNLSLVIDQEDRNDFLPDDTHDLSNVKGAKNRDLNALKSIKRRSHQGSWSLLGAPEEKVIYLRDDEPPRRLICYPAIRHVEGDVIQVKDSVLLRSGAKKTDLPFIAKVCAFWEDAETGSVMMSLFWYYRPEHTEEGRKPHHLSDEIFASRHRDVDSVECIEEKCYVLTFNEYCRYRKRCKMEQVNTNWSLTDVTIPVSNESYPRRNRIPESDVNPELVFCCRQIYDSRMRRLVKNPLINPKYGHI